MCEFIKMKGGESTVEHVRQYLVCGCKGQEAAELTKNVIVLKGHLCNRVHWADVYKWTKLII